jgi:hypothetical protein
MVGLETGLKPYRNIGNLKNEEIHYDKESNGKDPS